MGRRTFRNELATSASSTDLAGNAVYHPHAGELEIPHWNNIGEKLSQLSGDTCNADGTADWTLSAGCTLVFDTDHYEIATTAIDLGGYPTATFFAAADDLLKVCVEVKDGTAAGVELMMYFTLHSETPIRMRLSQQATGQHTFFISIPRVGGRVHGRVCRVRQSCRGQFRIPELLGSPGRQRHAGNQHRRHDNGYACTKRDARVRGLL